MLPHVLTSNADAEIVARLFVIPGEDVRAVRATAKRMVTAHLNVPVYTEFHRWAGPGGPARADVAGVGSG